MANFKVGTVTHYFDKIGVAVVDLTDSLAVGDTITVGDPSFTQQVESMQVEHEKIQTEMTNKYRTLRITSRH